MVITKISTIRVKKTPKVYNIPLLRNANYQITVRDSFSCNRFKLFLGGWVNL